MDEQIKKQIDLVILRRNKFKNDWACYIACKKIIYTAEARGLLSAREYPEYNKYIKNTLAV